MSKEDQVNGAHRVEKTPDGVPAAVSVASAAAKQVGSGLPLGHPDAATSRGAFAALANSVPSHYLDEVPVEHVTLLPSSRIVAVKGARDMAADRFRLLRMRMDGLRALGKLHTITITSALPKDGKSTISLNLASALAEGDRNRVLLIEADLHRPSIGNYLQIGNKPGLAECLESNLDPFSALRRIQPLGWYLLPAGTAQGNPTDLLQSPMFPGILTALAPLFDWVFVDTPPVLPLTDAISISQHTDATVLVVRAGETPRGAADEAVALLGANRIAAVIFNGAEGLNAFYDKYKYSGYYGTNKKKK